MVERLGWGHDQARPSPEWDPQTRPGRSPESASRASNPEVDEGVIRLPEGAVVIGPAPVVEGAAQLDPREQLISAALRWAVTADRYHHARKGPFEPQDDDRGNTVEQIIDYGRGLGMSSQVLNALDDKHWETVEMRTAKSVD